jgi:hypothetical protein
MIASLLQPALNAASGDIGDKWSGLGGMQGVN